MHSVNAGDRAGSQQRPANASYDNETRVSDRRMVPHGLIIIDICHVSPGQMILSHVQQSLLTYSQQVALGMQYLSSKSFVHRDLAARNVLVTKACVCKVCSTFCMIADSLILMHCTCRLQILVCLVTWMKNTTISLVEEWSL